MNRLLAMGKRKRREKGSEIVSFDRSNVASASPSQTPLSETRAVAPASKKKSSATRSKRRKRTWSAPEGGLWLMTEARVSVKEKRASNARRNVAICGDQSAEIQMSTGDDAVDLGTTTSSDDRESSDRRTDGTDFPFPTDPDDHCESPLAAYSDIAPLLRHAVAGTSGGTIYDPYYCNGAVACHLQSLGFPNVYNRKEDCYRVWYTPSLYPSFDVLVTNPPYSSDHIEKLVNHIMSPSFGERPWFLLLPNWVVKREYYQRATARIRPFYVVPRKRYVYLPPKNFRAAKISDVHKKSAPFVSMWYIWGGTAARNEELIRLFYKLTSSRGPEASCQLARSKSALRDLRRNQR